MASDACIQIVFLKQQKKRKEKNRKPSFGPLWLRHWGLTQGCSISHWSYLRLKARLQWNKTAATNLCKWISNYRNLKRCSICTEAAMKSFVFYPDVTLSQQWCSALDFVELKIEQQWWGIHSSVSHPFWKLAALSGRGSDAHQWLKAAPDWAQFSFLHDKLVFIWGLKPLIDSPASDHLLRGG